MQYFVGPIWPMCTRIGTRMSVAARKSNIAPNNMGINFDFGCMARTLMKKITAALAEAMAEAIVQISKMRWQLSVGNPGENVGAFNDTA